MIETTATALVTTPNELLKTTESLPLSVDGKFVSVVITSVAWVEPVMRPPSDKAVPFRNQRKPGVGVPIAPTDEVKVAPAGKVWLVRCEKIVGRWPTVSTALELMAKPLLFVIATR